MLRVIGLLSGTSADGIDVAMCEIDGEPPRISAQIRHAETIPFDANTRQQIFAAGDRTASRVDALARLDSTLGYQFAQAVLRVIAAVGLTPDQIDLIGSHGQTVWHEVDTHGHVAATLQIGQAAVIAQHTGITTISDLRTRDVAAGGQGAPLTAYADWLLLRHPTRWRAVQNIGGIGNVTLLPPLCDETIPALAFDTGPGNALIDEAVRTLTNGQHTFDLDGAIAARGLVLQDALARLMRHPYFHRVPPKTTGRELFGAEFAAVCVESMRSSGAANADIIATLTALTAHSIADAYTRFAPAPVEEIILSGGGRLNPTLVRMLRAALPDSVHVLMQDDTGISGDDKEALVFALLAYETWHHRVGTLPHLTGAAEATVLGHITPGNNFRTLIKKTWCGDE